VKVKLARFGAVDCFINSNILIFCLAIIGVDLLYLSVMVPWYLALLSGVAKCLITYSAVLIHEIGHMAAARHLGCEVDCIELNVLGGQTFIKSCAIGWEEFVVIVWGPICSLAMSCVAIILYASFPNWLDLLRYAVLINVILFIFNSIPVLPLDGGRIVRAVLSKWFSFIGATKIALVVSGLVLVVLNVVSFYYRDSCMWIFPLMLCYSVYSLYAMYKEYEVALDIQKQIN
jgi:stage IV sporulation protein FB